MWESHIWNGLKLDILIYIKGWRARKKCEKVTKSDMLNDKKMLFLFPWMLISVRVYELGTRSYTSLELNWWKTKLKIHLRKVNVITPRFHIEGCVGFFESWFRPLSEKLHLHLNFHTTGVELVTSIEVGISFTKWHLKKRIKNAIFKYSPPSREG